MLPTAATKFYALQQRVNTTTANEVKRAWRRMGDDFDSSWARVGPVALAVLTEAQLVVAEAAAEYVPTVLAETNLPDRPVGDFRPESLSGIASDGRRLDTLTYGAVAEAKIAVGNGATTAQALDAGESWIELMAKLQVADAARQAVGVMTAARPNLGGTVRVLNPPSCQRCAILAGRFYRWSKGFDRHPGCDCVNTPVPSKEYAEAEGFVTDPMDAYRRGEIKDLTQAQINAIEEGADIGQVVNAYRGISTTATRTRARPLSKVQRAEPEPALLTGLMADLRALPQTTERARLLTPEGIYQQARNRTEAISLLREYGYIT
jgi:hypothetical protein